MYVLRKSFGAWSEGTRVERSEASGLVQYAIFGKGTVGTAVPEDYVVKRRDMTRYGPAINGKERRRRERQVKKALGINVS